MIYELNPAAAVTVIIDMQRLFTEPASPYGNDGASVIEAVNALTATSRDKDIPVIFSRLEVPVNGSGAGLISDWPPVQEGFYCETSEWTDLDPRLVVTADDHHHSRSRPGAFWGGTLEVLLNSLDRHQVILGGLSLNNAISFTAHEAFSRDIASFVVSETVGLTPVEDASLLGVHLEAIGTWAAEVVTLDELNKRTQLRQAVQ